MSELDRLERYLKENGIRYERVDSEGPGPLNEHQLIVYDGYVRKWDAICHYGSFGYKEGLLEIYGSLVDPEKDGDTVAGWLTAEDVIRRIEGRTEQ